MQEDAHSSINNKDYKLKRSVGHKNN